MRQYPLKYYLKCMTSLFRTHFKILGCISSAPIVEETIDTIHRDYLIIHKKNFSKFCYLIIQTCLSAESECGSTPSTDKITSIKLYLREKGLGDNFPDGNRVNLLTVQFVFHSNNENIKFLFHIIRIIHECFVNVALA